MSPERKSSSICSRDMTRILEIAQKGKGKLKNVHTDMPNDHVDGNSVLHPPGNNDVYTFSQIGPVTHEC